MKYAVFTAAFFIFLPPIESSVTLVTLVTLVMLEIWPKTGWSRFLFLSPG